MRALCTYYPLEHAPPLLLVCEPQQVCQSGVGLTSIYSRPMKESRLVESATNIILTMIG